MAQTSVLWYIQRRSEYGDALVSLWAVQNEAANHTYLFLYNSTYSKYDWPPAYVQGSLWLRSFIYRDVNSLPQSIFSLSKHRRSIRMLRFSLRYPIFTICQILSTIFSRSILPLSIPSKQIQDSAMSVSVHSACSDHMSALPCSKIFLKSAQILVCQLHGSEWVFLY